MQTVNIAREDVANILLGHATANKAAFEAALKTPVCQAYHAAVFVTLVAVGRAVGIELLEDGRVTFLEAGTG